MAGQYHWSSTNLLNSQTGVHLTGFLLLDPLSSPSCMFPNGIFLSLSQCFPQLFILLYFSMILSRFWIPPSLLILSSSACRRKSCPQEILNKCLMDKWVMDKWVNEVSRDGMTSLFSLRIHIKTESDDLGKWSNRRLNWEMRCSMEE